MATGIEPMTLRKCLDQFKKFAMPLMVFILLAIPLVLLGLKAEPWQQLPNLKPDPYLQQVFLNTLKLVAYATFLSVVLGALLARAFARQNYFWGRSVLLVLLSIPIVMPSIVAVFALIALLGYQGVLNQILTLIGFSRWSNLYSFEGIILAQLFYNIPLCMRLFLPAWRHIPAEYHQLASQLSLSAYYRWRLLEWPVLRLYLPGIIALTALISLSSFVMVLSFSGGPKNTTLSVAIYESLRIEGNFSRAALMALLQFLLGLLGLWLLLRYEAPLSLIAKTRHVSQNFFYNAHKLSARICDISFILIASVFLILPTILLLIQSLQAPWHALWLDPLVWDALNHSIALALLSLILVVVFSLPLAYQLSVSRQQSGEKKLISLLSQLSLAISPLILSAGYLIAFQGDLSVWQSYFFIALINALVGIPYVLRLTYPVFLQLYQRYDGLTQQLSLKNWFWWRRIAWPNLRKPLASALALVACLSLGDLSAMLLFDTHSLNTLPLLLYRLLNAYRVTEATGVAALLLLLVMILFYGIEYGIKGRKR